MPAYLRYADQELEVVVLGPGEPVDLAGLLAERIRELGESGVLDDLTAAVVALDAVDHCFRQSGLWRGNIYLAGAGALAAVLGIVGVASRARRESSVVMRELAALELAYLFPIARKFRAGAYDGQIQYRLNGWGRALAARLAAGPVGAARAAEYRRRVGEHLADAADRYESFLGGLDVVHQDYAGDQLERAVGLPIPVLV